VCDAAAAAPSARLPAPSPVALLKFLVCRKRLPAAVEVLCACLTWTVASAGPARRAGRLVCSSCGSDCGCCFYFFAGYLSTKLMLAPIAARELSQRACLGVVGTPGGEYFTRFLDGRVEGTCSLGRGTDVKSLVGCAVTDGPALRLMTRDWRARAGLGKLLLAITVPVTLSITTVLSMDREADDPSLPVAPLLSAAVAAVVKLVLVLTALLIVFPWLSVSSSAPAASRTSASTHRPAARRMRRAFSFFWLVRSLVRLTILAFTVSHFLCALSAVARSFVWTPLSPVESLFRRD